MEKKFIRAFDIRVLDLDFFRGDNPQINPCPFFSGGFEWMVNVNLEGDCVPNYVSMFLSASEPQTLRHNWGKKAVYHKKNWERKASFYFVLLNQSLEEISRTPESGVVSFCADSFIFGWTKAFPVKMILEIKDIFTIQIYIKVFEDVEVETRYVNGFQVLSSQVNSVKQIFVEHPDIALGFKAKNQVVRTEYMNVLLSLLETVMRPPKSISETELSNAQSKLCELIEVGFKLDWLKTKLEEVKKSNIEGFRIQQLEEVKQANTEGFRILQLEEVKKANTDGFQIKKLEEHVKNLERTVSGLRVELGMEKAKSTRDAATVLSLSDLKIELANEKAKSANFWSFKKAFSDLRVELEKEKVKSTNTAAKVLSLKKTLSDLKIELANEKAKSASFLSFKEAFSDLKVELEKEKAKSTSTTSKVLSWKEIWSGLKFKKDHKKGDSEMRANLLSWEDGDLVSSTKLDWKLG